MTRCRSIVAFAALGLFLVAATPCAAQIRLFAAQSAQTCVTDEATEHPEHLLGGSIAFSGVSRARLVAGAILNDCAERGVGFLGLDLFVFENDADTIRAGGAVNLDVEGFGFSQPYLLSIRPEGIFAFRVLNIGDLRPCSYDPSQYCYAGSMWLDARVGYYKTRSAYVSVGLTIGISR